MAENNIEEISTDEEIVESVKGWMDSIDKSNPLFEIHQSLSEGKITYREHLHKVNEVVGYFVDTVGFVAGPQIVNIIHDKLQQEGTSNTRSEIVTSFISSLATLKLADDDDYL